MLMARVKEKSAQPIIMACTGRQYVKTEWRQVPAGMEKEAKAQPNLDTLSDAGVGGPGSDAPISGDLNELNVKALRGMAKELGLVGFGKFKKTDLIEVLLDATNAELDELEDSEDEPEDGE